MTRRRPPWGLVLLVAVGACHGAPEECDPLCPEALAVVERCLAEWGQEWGEGFGYADADDHRNWCETHLDEQVALAVDLRGVAEGQAWVAATCREQLDQLSTGDCEAYSASWSVWDVEP